MHDALIEANVPHELIDPRTERNLRMPHCFVASEHGDAVAKDAFDRMMVFISNKAKQAINEYTKDIEFSRFIWEWFFHNKTI